MPDHIQPVRALQTAGRSARGGYVREWVWSPAGAAYSLTQTVPERKQSPRPALQRNSALFKGCRSIRDPSAHVRDQAERLLRLERGLP